SVTHFQPLTSLIIRSLAQACGTWDIIAKFPGRFAAAIPIAAGWDPRSIRHSVPTTVWAFYNRDESAFNRHTCDAMLDAMARKGGVVRRTVYPSGGHDSWSAAYAEPDLIPWLFKQKRKP
ncbi:MAG: hypothetical protein WCO77_02150, partial [bacterium]